MSKYSYAKRVVQSVPYLREGLAWLITLLPRSVSGWLYRFSRKHVFVDNSNRLVCFKYALSRLRESTVKPLRYLEFGVARGTSIIATYDIANQLGISLEIIAFDSFEGLPGDEGSFEKETMKYSKDTFLNFVDRMGCPIQNIVCVSGYYNDSLTEELKSDLNLVSLIDPILIHIDCDLYTSTTDVLAWLLCMAPKGSFMIFDDWYAFEDQKNPHECGEQKAFLEWCESSKWKKVKDAENWNVCFEKIVD